MQIELHNNRKTGETKISLSAPKGSQEERDLAAAVKEALGDLLAENLYDRGYRITKTEELRSRIRFTLEKAA